MKDILVLLVLLNALHTKVSSLPYQADSDGNCVNSTTEYLLDGSNLCCKKCLPGQRLKAECSETSETVCEPCPTGQFMENWNYAQNCFSCTKCKTSKGLQDGQSCSSTTQSRCVCQPGWFCFMNFDAPYCTECNKYKKCKAGFGVSVQGTENTDVKCEQCQDGTFSGVASSTEPCQPHTKCQGRAVIRAGDATSDTTCEPEVEPPQTSTREKPRIKTTFTSASPATTTVFTSTVFTAADYEAPQKPTNSTVFSSPSVSKAVFYYSTKSPPQSVISDSMMVAVIAGVSGLILLFIAVVLILLRKRVWKKGTANIQSKLDANGNCESGDKVIQDYLVETQLTFTETSPEQLCLLQNGEACSDYSQRSNNTETLTQTDGCSSQESIGPLRSFVALQNPCSALSEPMTLLSNTEPVSQQSSIPTQCSSQPTSPQVISPVTTSPHVNVNITFHIGNGSCATPAITPTDLMQVDTKLPFGEAESFSIPQQEAGKQSLVSVQESESNTKD